jgi:hypothetical protein
VEGRRNGNNWKQNSDFVSNVFHLFPFLLYFASQVSFVELVRIFNRPIGRQ